MLKLNFDPFPALTTERLMLRRPLLSDDEATFILRSDVEQNRYLDRPIARHIDDARNFLQRLNEGIDRNENIAWAICLREDAALLGSVCFWNISRERQSADIGFELLPAWQGKGIMREAVAPALSYAFRQMGLAVVAGWAHTDNVRSIKLMQAFGFCRDAAEEAKHAGKDYFNDMQIYTLTREHYAATTAGRV